MTHRKQQLFLQQQRASGAALVLATVIETEGSTYSKPGARMLIDGEGRFQGMLSGGCLEGDLAMRARVAIESGTLQFAAYDLRADENDPWGLGVGCNGKMRVVLQAVGPAQDYEPVRSLLELQGGRCIVSVATCLESTDPAIDPGMTVVLAGAMRHGPSTAFADLARGALSEAALRPGETRIANRDSAAGTLRLLLSAEAPVPRLLVLGAGPDAEPLVRIATELGWSCTVADHRPAYVDGNDFGSAATRHCLPAEALAANLALDDFDLAVVMSHHLESDRAYLRQLAASRIPYLGLLGPPNRRQRLLSELPDCAERLAGRLHGPAGLNIGGRGPAAIALSIVAEMQQHLARDGCRSPGD